MTQKRYFDTPQIATSFEAVRQFLPGADIDDFDGLRGDAMSKYMDSGLPGPKVEEWKYTNLNFLANENFDIATAPPQETEIKELFEKACVKGLFGPLLVFVNGHYYKPLSSFADQKGIKLSLLSDNIQSFRVGMAVSDGDSSLNNLNRALVTDGYHLEIAPNVEMKQPLQVIHMATSGTDMTAMRYRVQIMAGAGAKAEIIESYIGADQERYWTHGITDVLLDQGADVTIYQFQTQGRQAVHMTELHSHVADKARFSHISLQLGAEINRTELINSFTGENADIELRGAYLGRNKQSQDIFTRINHDQPNCQSNQLYRGVLDAGGKSAFQGKVIVARDAQKTNADQSNKNLLLSRKAEANAKPELLIYADDVKCSHGTTVGELDPDQLFYLRSRGMDEVTAKGLLVEAFVAEVFDDIADETLRTAFKEKTARWLAHEVTP
ncbi:MAG: Fe-S cluster assembly protein SufD [Emcibacter sp.]|nr:Fe-S cluster assembly protein SufD [Emcibacter sp.]